MAFLCQKQPKDFRGLLAAVCSKIHLSHENQPHRFDQLSLEGASRLAHKSQWTPLVTTPLTAPNLTEICFQMHRTVFTSSKELWFYVPQTRCIQSIIANVPAKNLRWKHVMEFPICTQISHVFIVLNSSLKYGYISLSAQDCHLQRRGISAD